MDILHRTTDPPLLRRLQEMLAASQRADIAVGYFFGSGFEEVAEPLVGAKDRLSKARSG